MKGGFLLLGIIGLLAVLPAAAGTIYRCESADGVRSYVSKRVPGAQCSAVTSYSGGGSRPSRPETAASLPQPSRPATVGNATPEAVVSGSPASGRIQSADESAMTNASPIQAVKPGAPGSRVVSGQVYSYIKDGVRHYTSRKPAGLANAGPVRTINYSFIETCYACNTRSGVNFGAVRLNTSAYQDEIAAAARRHGVDEAVVRAIIHAESAYRPTAVSRAGAQGLMQLMPATARRFGVADSFDPGQNINGGVQYLAWLLKRFNGDLTLAAAGYNAGEGAVDRHKGVPPYRETQVYVQRVGVLAERYRQAIVQR
ncbi:lytic transglycosylase domain-containing protein [Marilutibacter alkalisoli]|uniref:Lytic transglycosylase domain-containing protein n=1 Tax=Marilutibacter alkalisoli TaxID=2591633 RepID=A0A514BPV4_9GAMM|nr:lytic transglycosylase domain-containing protein [Lysobacter alkalisoli]QDH69414.1 lytic transglycosylase domain-containing protein [Lysobacter alkalisoli]